MKSIYKIENLACGSCASKMEGKIKGLDGVEDAVVNFSTSQLHLKTQAKPSQDLVAEIDQIIRSIEKDAYLDQGESELGLKKDEEDEEDLGNRLKILISLGLFIVSFLVDNRGIKEGILVLAYVMAAKDVINSATKNIIQGQVFDENFLMTIASIGAIMIGELAEAVAVMVFFSIGEYFQDRAVDKSRKSISSLLNIRADYANLLDGGRIKKVGPETLKTGQHILIKPGEKVPLDGTIIKGSSSIDTSGITGESLPREVGPGETLLSGSINMSSSLTLRVDSIYENSTVAKILKLVEESGAKKAPTEKFITKFSKVYTPIVCFLALGLALVPPLVTSSPFSPWIYRAMVFLVASCPCALVISVPLGFFAGLGRLSKEGIIAKGANHLEDMARVGLIAFDKTGTLTKGKFSVDSIYPAKSVDKGQVLRAAAIGESLSNHPISQSIKEAYQKDHPSADGIEDLPGLGLVARLGDDKIYVGNAKLMEKFTFDFEEINRPGTLVYVGVNKTFLGSILIKDEVKEESKEIIADLHQEDIKSLMLTGDREEVARELAQDLGIDTYKAGLLPQDKVKALEGLIEKGRKTAFVGDGINDAPVLVMADVGIAMGQLGSDAAIEAADIVIMEDDLTSLPKLRKISKKTMTIVTQNIVFSLLIKVLVLGLGAAGYASMWAAVFADTGVALLAILNSIRLLYINSEK